MTKLLAILALLLAGSVNAAPALTFGKGADSGAYYDDKNIVVARAGTPVWTSARKPLRIGASDCHHVTRDGIRGLECGRYFTQDRDGNQTDFTPPVQALPLLVHNGRAYWLPYPALTDDQRARLMAWYLPGVIDPDEAAALDRFCPAVAADAISTAIALTCDGVIERNALLGADPSLLKLAGASWAACKYFTWHAGSTHRYQSSAKLINVAAGIRALATGANLLTISKASGCL